METRDPNRLSIFLSHRHQDKHIADIFRETFEDWSNGKVHVFQSSHAENAITIGEELDDSIKDAIAHSNVVLLIYTTENEDWSWCMYECGLAQDPEAMDTRIVVFHCTEEPPGPLKHLVTVPFDKAAIETLVEDFHRDSKFFPRHTEALAPNLDDDQITERSRELYDKLYAVIPDINAREVQRYDYLTLRLDLDHVTDLRNLDRETSFKETLARARDVIKEKAVIWKVVGEPHAHFNYEVIPEQLKLTELVERWRKESEHAEHEWHEELYEEMARAVLNRKERALAVPFNSLQPDTDTWFLPVVSRFRIIPTERVAEFDVLLCSIRSDVGRRMTGGE
jgi:hypothetical protein